MNSRIIDVNVNLFRWPMRRFPRDEPGRLAESLKRIGVAEAWAGSFEGLFHKDLAGVNDRLARECREQTAIRMIPFGSVNPMLPDWEEDLRRCAEDHRMPGIRLHPNYHGYPLDHEVVPKLLERAAKLKLIVQMALEMEDARMMHPLLRVPPVQAEPLVGLVPRIQGLRLILLNALRLHRKDSLARLLGAGDVSAEIGFLEGVGGLGAILEEAPADRILFGTHAPFFYAEAALLKFRESALAEPQSRPIFESNARRIMKESA